MCSGRRRTCSGRDDLLDNLLHSTFLRNAFHESMYRNTLQAYGRVRRVSLRIYNSFFFFKKIKSYDDPKQSNPRCAMCRSFSTKAVFQNRGSFFSCAPLIAVITTAVPAHPHFLRRRTSSPVLSAVQRSDRGALNVKPPTNATSRFLSPLFPLSRPLFFCFPISFYGGCFLFRRFLWCSSIQPTRS